MVRRMHQFADIFDRYICMGKLDIGISKLDIGIGIGYWLDRYRLSQYWLNIG